VKNGLTFVLSLACAGTLGAADFTVTNSSSSGPGSLYQAITDANALPGSDRIVFNIPGAGVQKIDVSQNLLPAVTDTLTIDGYTQPGSSRNTLAVGSNAVVLIRIDNTAGRFVNGAAGIVLQAPDCVVRGLMVTAFQQGSTGYTNFGGDGIRVLADRCTIEGNFIGTDGSSSTSLGNSIAGIYVNSSYVTIGGNTPAARNVIGGNTIGIRVTRSAPNFPSDHIRIIGNQIGTDEGGPTPAVGNRIGIALGSANDDFQDTIIGGLSPSQGNLIAGNDTGIRLAFTDTRTQQTDRANGVRVYGNAIGLQPNRSGGAQVNQGIGIEVPGARNAIGGLETGAGNVIAFNRTGVLVPGDPNGTATTGNRILSNIIYGNSIMPIDLVALANGAFGYGPTSNDLGDADTGPNNLQNFPIITRAGSVPSQIASEPNGSIEGLLNSAPNSEFTLQFFRYNPEPELLGTTQVKTDAAGNARFKFYFYVATPDTSDSKYTATATDADGDTSEFTPLGGPVQLANISTRGNVLGGDFIMIGGFIVRSDVPKKVAVRALGPSLNVPNKLADPYVEVYDGSGTLLAKNDDWRTGQQQEIINAGLAPASDVESALITTVPAGAYTAQVRGANGKGGTGLVEIYDLDPFPATSGRLVNISTRAFLANGGNDVLIGGTIIRGDAAVRVVVRAIGPDLKTDSPLGDPTLELRDSNGDLIMANDDWRQEQEAEITGTGLAPKDDRDSALVGVLAPGAYTALVRGKTVNGGVAVVEFYDLKN
jgi:hypothetical protein